MRGRAEPQLCLQVAPKPGYRCHNRLSSLLPYSSGFQILCRYTPSSGRATSNHRGPDPRDGSTKKPVVMPTAHTAAYLWCATSSDPCHSPPHRGCHVLHGIEVCEGQHHEVDEGTQPCKGRLRMLLVTTPLGSIWGTR